MKINQNYLMDNYTKSETTSFSEGDILTGTIQKVEQNDKVCVKLSNNYTLNFDKSEVSGNIGDSVTFSVLENKNNTILLKQLDVSTSNRDLINQNTRTVPFNNETSELNLNEIKKSNSNSYVKILQKTEIGIYESNLSIKKTKENLSYLSKTLGEVALKSLTQLGLNPEKLDIEKTTTIIEKTLGEDTSEESLSEENDIKVNIDKLGITEAEYYKYANLLVKFNLPITPENLLNLKNVDNKLDEIVDLTENSILNLVKNENNITLQDLYVCKYSTLNSVNNNETFPNIQIDNFEELVKNLFEEQEIQPSEENINLAKKFVLNEINISKENFEKYNLLSNIKEFIDKDYILENSTLNIIKNKNINSLEVFKTGNSLENKEHLKEIYTEIQEVLPNITTQTIQNLIDRNIPINLENISNEYNLKTVNNSQVNISEKAISERIKIAKIQMKLTYDAINRLSNTNIDITTEPLQAVIERLEMIELSIYEENLKIVGADINTNNTSIMQNTMSCIQNIYPINMYATFGKIINSEIDFSLDAINNELINTKSEKIIQTLEVFETSKNASFGDSISKLEGQFENLLKSNGLEVNEANLRASKILSLNNIDFDENILTQVKMIDNKINYIHDKLHPLAVAEIIKRGINPSTENIDSLISIVDEIAKEYSQSSKEKIAEYILDMDKEGSINDEERKAVIAFYRMLNLIEKNGSVAIGNLIKNQGKLTLQNLMEASSLYQKQKRNIDFDRKIDDSFGEISDIIIPENNINSNIKNAIELQNEYSDILVKRIIEYATPDTIQNLFKKPEFQNMPLEDILDEIKLGKELNNTFISTQTLKNIENKFRNLDLNDTTTLNWLIKNNIPVTIANIENMRDSIKGNFSLAKSIIEHNSSLEENQILPIDVISSDIEKNITSTLDFEQNIEMLENKADNKFDEIISLENFSDITAMLLQNKSLKEKLSFNKAINKIENGIYQIPIKLRNNTITNLNMYILNEKNLNTNDEINLFLSLETKNIGNVQVYISIKDNSVSLKISSNSTKGLQKLKNYTKEFEKEISKDFKFFNIDFKEEKTELNIYSNNFEQDFKEKINEISNEFNTTI